MLLADLPPHLQDRYTGGSLMVITKTNRSKEVRNLYGVTGVPTLVVHGKYRTTGTLAGGNDKMLQVVDFLIEKERAASTEQAPGTAQ